MGSKLLMGKPPTRASGAENHWRSEPRGHFSSQSRQTSWAQVCLVRYDWLNLRLWLLIAAFMMSARTLECGMGTRFGPSLCSQAAISKLRQISSNALLETGEVSVYFETLLFARPDLPHHTFTASVAPPSSYSTGLVVAVNPHPLGTRRNHSVAISGRPLSFCTLH